jgi:serine/threonine protein kinase/WD40 repeat protein
MNERSIFAAALDIADPGERAAYLESACGHEPGLRRHIDELLAAQDDLGSFLQAPVLGVPATAGECPLTERPGAVIGPYKLLEQIGEGGFGVVFMAEQQRPVRRKVALKVLKPGMDSKQVVARFEAERQALAWMDHPHIAHVLDAGTTDWGRPYFVMELIPGIPMTQFCDDNRLTPRERLELFLSVCQAVQHAHQKGIIHRDLKPSNVLVMLLDGAPVAKVIDFGIAKALGHERLTDKTLFTGFAHMIGTPLYMSPEQAERSGQDADTRTDIYSLGVLLYELLTGTTPFDKERLKEASYDEIRRIIREEEPDKPSTRISTLGPAAASVSANRKSEPRRLSQLCRRELDWIVMKALEKDRNRRYDTASSFAADVQRYLDDEPVQACPPTLVQRAVKWSRRHQGVVKTGILGLILAFLILILSTLLIASAYQREAKEHQNAVTAFYHSLVQGAQAIRRARADGYRTKAWQLLQQALQLQTPDKNVNQLRQEAVGCMGDYAGFDPITWSNFPAEVNTIALHPNGRLLAIGLENGRVLLWDLRTGTATAELPLHALPIHEVVFSPDGTRLVSGDSGGTIQLCEAKANAEWVRVRTIRVEPLLAGLIPSAAFPFFVPHLAFPELGSLAISSDGKQLAGHLSFFPSLRSTMAHWTLEDGARTARFGQALEWQENPAFSPDGRFMTACMLQYSGAGAARRAKYAVLLWDLHNGGNPREFLPELGPLNRTRFSPDSKVLACACEEGLALLDTTTFQLQRFPQVERTPSVAFSPDSRLLAIANNLLGQVRVWNVTSRREVAILGNPSRLDDMIHSVACSQDAVVAASRRAVHKWNLAGSGEKLVLAGHSLATNSVVFSPDGKLLVSAGKDRSVKLWDPATGQLLKQFTDFGAAVEANSFSPDGKLLATGDWSGAIQIRDVASGKQLAALFGTQHKLGVLWSVAFSPDGRYFAASGGGGVALWRILPRRAIPEPTVSLKLERHWSTYSCASDLLFSPDNELLAWVEWGDRHAVHHAIHIWDLKEACERPFPLEPLLHCYKSLAFLRSSTQLLFVAERTGMAEVWDLPTGCKAFTIGEQEAKEGGWLDCIIALSPDDARLAAITGRNVTVWDTASRSLLLKLPEEKSFIHSLAWSPDRQHLAVGTADGGIAIWKLRTIKAQLEEIGLGW